MGYHEIRDQDIPRWHWFKQTAQALTIFVDPACWEQIRSKIPPTRPQIRDRSNRDSMELPTFIPATEPTWGSGQIVQTIKRSDCIELRCPWPVMKPKATDDIDWRVGYAYAATLESLFATLLSWDGPTSRSSPQLFVVDGWEVMMDMYGAALTVMLSKAMCAWMKRRSQGNIPEVEVAMRRVYRTIWKDSLYAPTQRDFQTWVEDGALHLTCPGNACGLDPEDHIHYEGYRLLPHNTDSPGQQLTLLAGVVALSHVYLVESGM